MDTKTENILIQYLHNERVEVTYKLLSRKAKIPVNQAKRALQNFYDKTTHNANEMDLVPIYCLCRNEDEFYIGSKPEESESKNHVKILHLYALSPSNVEHVKENLASGIMEDSLYMIDSSVSHSDSVDDIQKCRSILHPSMTYSTDKKVVVKQEPIMLKSNSAPTIGKAKPISSVKPVGSKMTKSNSTMSANKTKSFFASKVKTEPETKSESKPSTKFVAKSGSIVVVPENSVRIISSPEKSVQPETVIKKEVIPVAVSKESLSQANQIINMFDEDEKMESVQSPSDQVGVISAVSEEKSSNQNEARSEIPTRKVIKRRKVIKSETYMEGKYLKTRDVEIWEEYECDEVNPEPRQQSRLSEKISKIHSKSSKPSSSKEGKQTSLASFFLKKS